MNAERKQIHIKPGMYALLFYELKEMAKNYGYNLVLHGSLNRDMDLIAIPWTDEPRDEQEMIKEFQAYLTGHTMITLDGSVHYTILPGNRHSYVIDLNRGSTKGEWIRYSEPEDDEQYYLDISVVQPAKPEVADAMPTEEEIEVWAENCAGNSVQDNDLRILIKGALILGCDWFRNRVKGGSIPDSSHKCCVCHENYVDSDNGFDTCHDCLSRI